MGLLIIPFLYWSKIIGIINNTLFGMDKIIFGVIIGLVIFLLAVEIDKKLRWLNKGKVFIYYQKIIIPVFLLSVVSLILYFITN